MRFAKLAPFVASCFTIGSAAAQPAPVIPSSQSTLPEVLSTSGGATFDGRVDGSVFDRSDFEVIALTLHGQYVSSTGPGAYLSLPLAHGAESGDDVTYVGNLELGSLYVMHSDHADAYVRGGVALGQTNTYDPESLPLATMLPRPADAFTTGLGSWLRGGGGVRWTRGALVLGGSTGLDIALDTREDWGRMFHFSGSIGVARPRFGLAGGTTWVTGLMGAGAMLTFQGVGDVRLAGRTRLYVASGLSFDKALSFSLGLGVRAGI